jgi:starvation-inducible DNA-binding protein
VYSTKNDAPKATRAAIVSFGNGRLADAIDLETQCKQTHWNAKNASLIVPQARTGRDGVDALSSIFVVRENSARTAIDERGEPGDANTAEISRSIDQWFWFTEAHLDNEGRG